MLRTDFLALFKTAQNITLDPRPNADPTPTYRTLSPEKKLAFIVCKKKAGPR